MTADLKYNEPDGFFMLAAQTLRSYRQFIYGIKEGGDVNGICYRKSR